VLPSFRLIATTFLCGFALVYAGLRMIAPGMALEPGLIDRQAMVVVQRTTAGLPEWRQAEHALPAIFDRRFEPGETGPILIPASIADHAADRAAALLPARIPLPDLLPTADRGIVLVPAVEGGLELAALDGPAAPQPAAPPAMDAHVPPDASLSVLETAATTDEPAALTPPMVPASVARRSNWRPNRGAPPLPLERPRDTAAAPNLSEMPSGQPAQLQEP